MDIPFYYIGSDSSDSFEEKEYFLEAYKCAGIWHWLMVTPPAQHIIGPAAASFLEEENKLLSELRGARFIRLLPHLPAHYTRYGVSLDEAMAMEPPDGAESNEGLIKFNPFDQDLAKKELTMATERLFALFDRMYESIPEYAAARKNPLISVDNFIALLNDHRK